MIRFFQLAMQPQKEMWTQQFFNKLQENLITSTTSSASCKGTDPRMETFGKKGTREIYQRLFLLTIETVVEMSVDDDFNEEDYGSKQGFNSVTQVLDVYLNQQPVITQPYSTRSQGNID